MADISPMSRLGRLVIGDLGLFFVMQLRPGNTNERVESVSLERGAVLYTPAVENK